MPVIDLTRYIVAADGPWTDPSQEENLFGFTTRDTQSPDRLMLRWAGDFVALTGPLSIRVTVQAENMTVPLALVGNLAPVASGWQGGAAQVKEAQTLRHAAAPGLVEAALARNAGTYGNAAAGLQASTIYTYVLEVAAGQAWPFSLSEHLESYRLQNVRASRFEQLGNNLGYRVIIEPAFAIGKATPVRTGGDLPCDFGVADQPHSAEFFPAACEPCRGSVVGLPAGCSTSLATAPAAGGVVRTHFFDGMFITREDMETEQRYHRMKSRLHNRAAGQGVVWGLAIGKQGSHVCVTPGYAVDCCGNDLVLSSVYEVEVAALLCDPEIARVPRQGAQSVSLLLEYVECPSNPRPVHGDICAPEQARCEMSRIRESVRLRLVPHRKPEDCVESLPLRQFLAEVEVLRKRYPLDSATSVFGAASAPFQLRFTAPKLKTPLLVRPSAQTTSKDFDPLVGMGGPLQVEIQVDPLWGFAAGTIAGAASRGGVLISGVVTPPDPQSLAADSTPSLQFGADASTAAADRWILRLDNWQAQSLFAPADAQSPGGNFALSMVVTEQGIREIEVQSTVEQRPLDLADAPCDGDSCQPRGTYQAGSDCRSKASGNYEGAFRRMLDGFSRDPASVLPWLHADPVHPGAAGDPKALLLGMLGGWLAQELVRERAGTTGEVLSPRRQLAQGIYHAAWLMLFGVSHEAAAAELGGTLKRLLEAWCDGLLWRGPQCCGEPHGVVIGCAILEGGALQRIDPFGGRRYVVHYPLVAHWAAQFGIAPPDITASALFSKICCLAALPAIGIAQPRQAPVNVIAIGGGWLAVGEPAAIAVEMQRKLGSARVNDSRPVGLPEFIAGAVRLGSTSNKPKPTAYDVIVLTDVVPDGTLLLFTPA